MRRGGGATLVASVLAAMACGTSGSPSAPGPSPGVDAGAASSVDAQAEAQSDATPSTAVVCDPARGATTDVGQFRRYAIESAAAGPAFVAIGDVNGDGRRDLVVSSFGPIQTDGASVTLSPGTVVAYLRGETLGCWQRTPIVVEADGLHFPNKPTLADVDADGDLDVVVAAGFFVCAYDKAVGNCGAIAWMENTGGGRGWKRHDIVPAGATDDYTSAVLADIDADGTKDLVSVGESSGGVHAVWFKGDASAERFSRKPVAIGDGGGSFPVPRDLDGDGDLDLASAEYYVKDSSFAWFEQTPTAWTRHVADATSGRGFMLDFVPDLYGDGVTRAVGTNHVNTSDDATSVASSVFVFDMPADPRAAWAKTPVSTGIVSRPSVGQAVEGAPGVFGWGDVDGDGDIDLAVAGDGDARTFWMEQTGKGAFAMHMIEPSLEQAAGALVDDVDGDGKNELVFTGYKDGTVYLYAFKR